MFCTHTSPPSRKHRWVGGKQGCHWLQPPRRKPEDKHQTTSERGCPQPTNKKRRSKGLGWLGDARGSDEGSETREGWRRGPANQTSENAGDSWAAPGTTDYSSWQEAPCGGVLERKRDGRDTVAMLSSLSRPAACLSSRKASSDSSYKVTCIWPEYLSFASST